MPLYIVHRPAGADHLKNPAAIHGAIVDAADGPAAIAAANALAPDLNAPFTGYTATLATSAAPALVEGDLVGPGFQRRRGA